MIISLSTPEGRFISVEQYGSTNLTIHVGFMDTMNKAPWCIVVENSIKGVREVKVLKRGMKSSVVAHTTLRGMKLHFDRIGDLPCPSVGKAGEIYSCFLPK